MTDKVQKIREEAEKRYEYLKEKESISHSIESETRMSECHHLLLMFDSLQEEPVSEELEEASKEWLKPQLDKSYADYGETKMMELTHFDGYAMLDAIEFGAKWQKQKEYTCYEEAFEDGAKWKNEQMMAKAIDAHCFGFQGAALFSFKLPADKYLVGSKVKVFVIKED